MVLRRRRLLRRPEGTRHDDRRRLCDHTWPAGRHRAVDVRVGSILRSPTLGRLRRFADEVARRLDVAKELLPELANQHRLPFVFGTAIDFHIRDDSDVAARARGDADYPTSLSRYSR